MKHFLIALASCALTFGLAQGAKTGKLAGHVDIGPVTPVERPGHPAKVPPEWYKRNTVVITQRGPHNGHMQSHLIRLVAELKLSGTGDFAINLNAGEYQVGVKSTQPMRQPPTQKTVMIVAGKTVTLTFHVDTGIR